MLGTSLVITLDGSGGTAKTLPLINQDGYSSEYYLDDTTVTYRAKVRHSRDNVKSGSQPFDRHTDVLEVCETDGSYPPWFAFGDLVHDQE